MAIAILDSKKLSLENMLMVLGIVEQKMTEFYLGFTPFYGADATYKSTQYEVEHGQDWIHWTRRYGGAYSRAPSSQRA